MTVMMNTACLPPHIYRYVLKQLMDLYYGGTQVQQSFRFCRPIQIQYRPETTELILREKNRVEEEIKQLTHIYAENSAGYSINYWPS